MLSQIGHRRQVVITRLRKPVLIAPTLNKGNLRLVRSEIIWHPQFRHIEKETNFETVNVIHNYSLHQTATVTT